MTISNISPTAAPLQATRPDQTREPSAVYTAPNENGGTTFFVSGPPLKKGTPHFISGFQTGRDRLDLSNTLRHMNVASLNFNHSDPSDIKQPGDTYLNYVPAKDRTYIGILGNSGQLQLNLIVEGQVRIGDIVGSSQA